MSYNPNEKRERMNPRQIWRAFTQKTFIEVIGPTPEFEKIEINIQNYSKGQEGSKLGESVSVFYDLPEFLALIDRLRMGTFKRTIEAERARMAQQNITYGEELFVKQGGTPKFSRNGNNDIEARKFYFQPGKIGVLVKGEKGIGMVTKEGLTAIDYNRMKQQGIPVTRVMIPLTYDQLLEMACIAYMRLQAYVIARQLNGDYSFQKAAVNNEDRMDTPRPVASAPTPQVQQQAPIQQVVYQQTSNEVYAEADDFEYGGINEYASYNDNSVFQAFPQ